MAYAVAQRPLLGIGCMVIGMFCVSLNDMFVKSMSGDYALHQLIFVRSFIAVSIACVFLQFEGGWRALKVSNPWLHVLRGALIVLANSAMYAAIVAMPLATATAIYFVAPLFVTLLAIPILGEHVGLRRITAIAVGFLGVLVILWPELDKAHGIGWIAVLPIVAAFGYASMSVLTRKLGENAPASVLGLYVQTALMVASIGMFAVAGDGHFLDGSNASDSTRFLLREWVWPQQEDWALFGVLGVLSGIVGYVMSQAYRLAAAATVAPFEYLMLLFALIWGWSMFGEWPAPTVFVGAAIIIGSGIYIVWRER